MSTASSFSDGYEAEPHETLNVLIAYDDLAAAQRAMRLFARVGRGQTDDLHTDDLLCQPQLWRFDLLADPDWRKCAASDALRADLIVVAASSPLALPRPVQSWLARCLARKQGAHAAVVALLRTDAHTRSPDSPGLQFLQSAATEAGLDFFVALRDSDASAQNATLEPAEAEVTRSIPNDERFFSPPTIPELRPAALPQPWSLGVPCRGWGINE